MTQPNPNPEGSGLISSDPFSEITSPIYVVIFSSILSDSPSGYEDMATKMLERAKSTEGFIHFESCRQPNGHGVSLSYWQDLDSIKGWKNDCQHLVAQKFGKTKWYDFYRIEIARIEKSYVGGKKFKKRV